MTDLLYLSVPHPDPELHCTTILDPTSDHKSSFEDLCDDSASAQTNDYAVGALTPVEQALDSVLSDIDEAEKLKDEMEGEFNDCTRTYLANAADVPRSATDSPLCSSRAAACAHDHINSVWDICEDLCDKYAAHQQALCRSLEALSEAHQASVHCKGLASEFVERSCHHSVALKMAKRNSKVFEKHRRRFDRDCMKMAY